MGYPNAEKRSKVIRIPEGMNDAIEEFLKTKKAHVLGFRYKSDILEAAVRDLLMKYGVPDLLEKSGEERRE
jgi:hypothetical protein